MACEYCGGPIHMCIKVGDASVTVFKEDAQMMVEWFGEDGLCDDQVSINFCPMCGEKLGGDA